MEINRIYNKFSIFILIILIIFLTSLFLSNGNNEKKAPLLSGDMNKFIFSKDKISHDIYWFDLKGNKFSLKQLKGNVILMNFWASWCIPCVKELPSINELSHNFSNRNFRPIVINIDKRNKTKAIRLFDSLGLNKLNFVYDRDNFIANKLKIDVVPTTIIFNKKGEELGRLYGEANWSSTEVKFFLEYFME